MEIEIQLTDAPIAETISPPSRSGVHGAWVEFRGVVRADEKGKQIAALEYEAYPEMAVREIRRLLEDLGKRHPCFAVRVIHRVGVVPASEAAIYIGIASAHRAEAIALLGEFMDRLKLDVPIWKRRAIAAGAWLCQEDRLQPVVNTGSIETIVVAAAGPATAAALRSLEEAVAEIHLRCQPLPPVRVPLEESFGRVLRETVCAPGDLPPFDCSTRDGFAILAADTSEHFQVVDTIHAAGWQPRQLKTGEAVRVATGAALPCGGVRAVMQENVKRDGDRIHIVKNEHGTNLRRRGEEVKAGQPLVPSGARLDAGKLALLATAGCVQSSVSPRLRVAHLTTGDEIIPPGQTPKPGQIRDSNSILIRSLLQRWPCDVFQTHLPEDFEQAKSEIGNRKSEIDQTDLVLVSGGASVGEKDFTRPLLAWLGFEIVFSQVNVRPGRPLIFGVNGSRVAFGLPGNPLSHFVCFHFAVATALARLSGKTEPKFLRGRLAAKLDDPPCPRETLWPARLEFSDGKIVLHPLPWASSGDVTCFAAANALIHIPVNQGKLDVGAEVDFLPTTAMMEA
jgi:molybdopterin molybdotransferase